MTDVFLVRIKGAIEGLVGDNTLPCLPVKMHLWLKNITDDLLLLTKYILKPMPNSKLSPYLLQAQSQVCTHTHSHTHTQVHHVSRREVADT